jgi:hypothetical protein
MDGTDTVEAERVWALMMAPPRSHQTVLQEVPTTL